MIKRASGVDMTFMPSPVDVLLVSASASEAGVLAQIQRRAFDSEAAANGWNGPAGPEGYDTENGMLALMEGTEVLRIDLSGATVGGMVVINSGTVCRLVRIFVEPEHQRKGIGHRAFGLLLERYPAAAAWELDTPAWSKKNHRFYESLGFVKTGETDEGERGFRLFLYERRS
jgi:GNAT superfamily N-acetyltransferase